MENKVGDKRVSAQKMNALTKQVDGLREAVRPHGVMLSSEERRRILRPRRGADAEMQRVHELAVKYKVTVPDVPLEGMQDDLDLARQMEALAGKLAPTLTLIQDTAAQADSEAWQAFLAHYAVLSSMATRVPELAEELAPTIAFMAVGSRQVATPAPTAPSAPPAPAAPPPPASTPTEPTE